MEPHARKRNKRRERRRPERRALARVRPHAVRAVANLRKDGLRHVPSPRGNAPHTAHVFAAGAQADDVLGAARFWAGLETCTYGFVGFMPSGGAAPPCVASCTGTFARTMLSERYTARAIRIRTCLFERFVYARTL